jgi:peptidylprolyl isomerase
MAVVDGDKVKVEYTGTFDGGEVFDSSVGKDPLEFQVGAHQVVPGFEKAVLGRNLNEEFSIRLEPEEAYGPYHPDGEQQIPRDQLPPDLEPQVGMMLQLEQQHEDHTHPIPAWITKVDEKAITLDMNHPMAGKTLNFKMKVVGIN